jgi:hypothetical protein
MRRMCSLAALLFLLAGVVSASTIQKWTTGWDDFSEPLNLTKSTVVWSVNTTTRKMTITFNLVGANPSKLYQVGVHIFCTTIPATFGQFPTGGACSNITRQGVTASITAVEFGVVTTDIHGNGKFTVVVGPIIAGTYKLEFDVRNGAGCGLTGGAGSDGCYLDCPADFQSPGPTFGDATTVNIP